MTNRLEVSTWSEFGPLGWKLWRSGGGDGDRNPERVFLMTAEKFELLWEGAQI